MQKLLSLRTSVFKGWQCGLPVQADLEVCEQE